MRMSEAVDTGVVWCYLNERGCSHQEASCGHMVRRKSEFDFIREIQFVGVGRGIIDWVCDPKVEQ